MFENVLQLDWCPAAINSTNYTHLKNALPETARQGNLQTLKPNDLPEFRTTAILWHGSGEGYRSVCFTLVPTVAPSFYNGRSMDEPGALPDLDKRMSNYSDRSPEIPEGQPSLQAPLVMAVWHR